MMTTKRSLVLAAVLTVSLSGCLKTRAQLFGDKDGDSEQASKPVPSKVQDVPQQGNYAIDEIKGEITRMSGRIEDLERSQKNGQEKSEKATQEELKQLNSRMADLEKAQTNILEALKKYESKAVPASDPTQEFDQGKARFKKNDYEAAIDSFTSYLKFPKGKHTEEATYLRAESYYQLKQYKKAIVDYSKFPEKFTKSKRVPAALYKIGLSFDALGLHDDAKGFYQELADRHPNAPETKKVRQKLR